MTNEPNRAIKELQGRRVEFGGEEHSGWLPAGAAWPRPTPVEVAVVDFEISEVVGGYLLEWYSRNTNHWGDTWHDTLEGALEEARHSFGIQPDEWQPVEHSAG
jgi:hypothetical protein